MKKTYLLVKSTLLGGFNICFSDSIKLLAPLMSARMLGREFICGVSGGEGCLNDQVSM